MVENGYIQVKEVKKEMLMLALKGLYMGGGTGR